MAHNLRVDYPVAKDYLEKYHTLYPGFRKLMYECEDFAKMNGYIELWTGRLRHFNVPEADPHKAMSNLIQGGVAEMVRVAISRLYPAMKDIGANMLMQVHDSIIFEVPEQNINVALPTIELLMTDFDFSPKPGIDAEYGYSWGLFKHWDGELVDIATLPKPN